MGMSIEEKIEEDLKHCSLNGVKYSDYVKEHYISKANYEVRLKADMVAMLEDLDLKIDEMYEPQFSKEGMDGFYWAQGLFKDLVQEKINALGGNENA